MLGIRNGVVNGTERQWPNGTARQDDLYFGTIEIFANKNWIFLTGSGLVEVPDDASGGANFTSGILARGGVWLAAKRCQDLALIFSRNEKHCIAAMIQHHGSEGEAIGWLRGRADCRDPVLFFIKGRRIGE